MSKVQKGNTVKVSYIGTLEDGTVFDRSKEGSFLEFTVGSEQLIVGFDRAVVDMEVGQTKTVTIPAAEAYGEYNEEHVVEVTRSRMPDNIIPEPGQRLEVQDRNGDPLVVTVKDITKNTVILDANHDLAGKDLTFEITLQEIVSAAQ